LQDPRTKRFNFDPHLLNIPSIDDFRFDTVPGFIPSGKDETLADIATELNTTKANSVKYYSSTSSMTSVLKHFHTLLSKSKHINTSQFSKAFPESASVAPSMNLPSSSIVSPRGTSSSEIFYSIDSDKTGDMELVLSLLGHELELFFTTPPDEFKQHLHSTFSNSSEPPPDVNVASCYNYAKISKFLMRSQLDARHPDLPNKGTFDIKTRAVAAIRYDIHHTHFHPTDYSIVRTHGLFESFEREMFDCARSTLLKYQLQARIGNMDGIFIALHNVKKVFGFYYLSLDEIDHIIQGYSESMAELGKEYKSVDKCLEELDNIVDDFGSHYQTKREHLSVYMADFEFKSSMKIWEDLLDHIDTLVKGRPFRLITRYEGKHLDDHIEVIVNVLDDESLKLLTNTTDKVDEIVKENELSLKDDHELLLTPTDRIQHSSKNLHKLSRNLWEVNNKIFQSTKNETYLFAITADHYINGKKSTTSHPEPPTSIIDPGTKDRWEIKYSLKQVTDMGYIKRRYKKFIKSLRCLGGEISVLPKFEDGEAESRLYLDTTANIKQRILRAYSAKNQKRELTNFN
ncbi:hypothetical protein CANARDRAFT_187098, partial [[Candida] arabinofermentans NRRL YB-2248]